MEGEESLQRAANLKEHNLRAVSDTRKSLSSLGEERACLESMQAGSSRNM